MPHKKKVTKVKNIPRARVNATACTRTMGNQESKAVIADNAKAAGAKNGRKK